MVLAVPLQVMSVGLWQALPQQLGEHFPPALFYCPNCQGTVAFVLTERSTNLCLLGDTNIPSLPAGAPALQLHKKPMQVALWACRRCHAAWGCSAAHSMYVPSTCSCAFT